MTTPLMEQTTADAPLHHLLKTDRVVVLGTGQAGVQFIESLRQYGFSGSIVAIEAEGGAPYQRPPLSKDYITDGQPAPLPLRPDRFFVEHDVEHRCPAIAVGIDRDRQRVRLSDGTVVDYTRLVLATGARNRDLPTDEMELNGVYGLRTLTDAQRLHQALEHADDLVVVGAGFIGLEAASGAVKLGKKTTVLEFADRPMARAVTHQSGERIADIHRDFGMDLRLGEGLQEIRGSDGRVTSVVGTSGAEYPADAVIVGIGVIPNTEVAAEAGLATDNGIVVDARMATSAPGIFAIGDCANFPNRHAGKRTRLESIQNATDQARYLAGILAEPEEAISSYEELPWFWSNQGDVRLQIAGLSEPDDETLFKQGRSPTRFSVFGFRDGILCFVESVNSPSDHVHARKLLTADVSVSRQTAEAHDFNLKAMLTTLTRDTR